MYKVYIETPGAGLVYDSDIDLKEFLIREQRTIEFPGLKIYDTIPDKFLFTVKYFNSKLNIINCNPTSIEIYYPIEELTPASIIFMGYILMEKQRANKSMITIHSACVEKDDKSILILGRIGSGKTTTAINLCLNKGYSIVSNDRTVIGLNDNEIVAYDGTKYFFLRYESVKRNIPKLLWPIEKDNFDSWLTKRKMLPSEIGINECHKTSQITRTYIIHIDNEKKRLYTSSGDTPENRLYLNELLSMYIRGMYTTFSDKHFRAKGYIPSYDSEGYYMNRVRIIDKIITDTQLEYISGDVYNVTNYIDENQKKLIYK